MRQRSGGTQNTVCEPGQKDRGQVTPGPGPQLGLAPSPNLWPTCCMRKHNQDGVAQRMNAPVHCSLFLFPSQRMRPPGPSNGPYHDNPGPNCFTKKSAHDNNRRSPEDPIIEYKCRSAKACQGLNLLERSAACHCWQLVRVRRRDWSPVHPGPCELLPYQHSEVSLKTRPLDSNHFDSVLCVQAPLRSAAPWVGIVLRVFLQTTLHDNNDADDYWYQSY